MYFPSCHSFEIDIIGETWLVHASVECSLIIKWNLSVNRKDNVDSRERIKLPALLTPSKIRKQEWKSEHF